IGIPDARLVPWLAQRFEESELLYRYGAGRTVAQTGPHRLLEAIAEHLDRRDAATMASLLRHPALEAWLCPKDDADQKRTFIEELDDYRAAYLPTRLASRRIAAAGGRFRALHAAVKKAEDLLAP